MDWVSVLVSGLGASFLSVLAAAASTWFFSIRTEHKRQQGVRALVAQELMQNETTVRLLIGEFKQIQRQADIRLVVFLLQRRKQLIPWQQARWLLPDVGVAFSLAELTKLTEWYVKLDHLTYLHYTTVDAADSVARAFSPPRSIPEDTATTLMGQLQAAIDFAESMLQNSPESPDSRFEKDRGMKQYVQGLKQRFENELRMLQRDHPLE